MKLILSSLAFGMVCTVAQSQVARQTPLHEIAIQADPIIEQCQKLSYLARHDLIRKLGKEKNFRALEALCVADFGNSSSYAAAISVIELPDAMVIAFCKKFDVGSANWRAAFLVLDAHKKQVVMDYIKQMVQSPSPDIRGCCYEVCLKAGWPDLRKQAEADAQNNTAVTGINSPWPETVGLAAREYLRELEKLRKLAGKK